jgi:glucuronate isomerase
MTTQPFINDNFLLHGETARTLYHCYAKDMPIIDYHCHLPPVEVAEDKRWANLADLWLGGDHYKWRGMRSNGVDERLITGNSTPREKFQAYAESMPRFLRNPLFDWSHLELARYFGIYDILSPKTADAIWEKTTELLASPGYSARGFMERSNVRIVCTTDDPTDTLEHHKKVRESGFGVKMFPAWRPDKAMAIDRPEFWNKWLDNLEAATDTPCCDFDDMINALAMRHAFFHENGCRLSDYGIETVPDVEMPSPTVMNQIFRKVRTGGKATPEEIDLFRFGTLVECGHMDAEAGWTWQLHYGALRNACSRVFESLGPDTGVDCIHDLPIARGLARLLDMLDRDDNLPRTILYTLNPRDNYLLGTLMGCFQRGPDCGKIQFGSGWWFNDQKHGMRDQLNALSELGLLSRFVGMLTDSRSFLSYPRHEYFRRILCDMLGSEIDAGDIPNDVEWVGGIVRDICYNNAASYFHFAE